MCVIFRNDLIDIASFMYGIIDQSNELPIDKLTEHIKDKLADAKESGKIGYCGCDGLFQIKKEGSIYVIHMEILNNIKEFELDFSKGYVGIQITDVNRSAVDEGYDDMVYNEYIEEKQTLTEEDFEAFISGDEYK